MSRLIGNSRKFSAVVQAIDVVAAVDSSVLLLGETGTGKEVVARAIHARSRRGQEPFVAVNCAALPSALVESELFGHERGAFTGAVAASVGRFQAANGGTLFLDEVGDLPLEMQPKLLRALQERTIERLGSSGRPVAVDARVIAATNRDLWTMVERGVFRADLYFRLNVFPITIPPLRERAEDIPLLVQYFAGEFAQRQNKSLDGFAEDWMEALKGRSWPGNVRELQNIVERAVITSSGGVLRGPASEQSTGMALPQVKTLADVEKAHILQTLGETNWVVGGWNGAAARLGLSRTTLIAKMQRLGLSKPAVASRDPTAVTRGDSGYVAGPRSTGLPAAEVIE